MEDTSEFPDSPSSSQSSRRQIIQHMSVVEKQIREAEKKQNQFKDEARAHEQKKNLCSVLVGVAIANDGMTVLADVVSFGMLGSLTAPTPGILRFMVSAYEREQKPERLLRTVAVMGLKAIPVINVLPATTFLMVTDLVEASADMDMARNKKEAQEKKIKILQNELRQLRVAGQQAA
ncbi:hypothetical protein HY732_02175 [Candidatus Uhrbacteria bacterium]|nr:hypothetical protein [Candidatus Uhrbacteria bacterium]